MTKFMASVSGLFGSRSAAGLTRSISEECCLFAESAWAVTPEFMESDWDVTRSMYAPASISRLGSAQNPLSRIMCVRHSQTSTEDQEALADLYRFRQCVMHVLQDVTIAQCQAAIVRHGGNGYHRPVVDTLRWAIEEGLVGAERKLRIDCQLDGQPLWSYESAWESQ